MSEMFFETQCTISGGTLNPTHSLTHSLTILLFHDCEAKRLTERQTFSYVAG